MSAELPPSILRLFWDVDASSVDLELHQDYVMERVMTRGDWESMKWLRRTYSPATMASFIERKGRTRLSPRDLAYWSLIADVPYEPERGGGRPGWAGP